MTKIAATATERVGLQSSTLALLEIKPSRCLSVSVSWAQNQSRSLCNTNCRSIEVPLLYSASLSSASPSTSWDGFHSKTENAKSGHEENGALDCPAPEMEPIQERLDITPIATLPRATSASTPQTSTFPFLSQPLELRLNVYNYLLPSRHHTIVTQVPFDGYFFGTSSIPAHSTQSLYPFRGTKTSDNLTTYKVLSTNSRNSYPSDPIYPDVLGTNRQVKEEAETVLYGNSQTVWEFGVHLDACISFWRDRGMSARRLVTNLRVAIEIPEVGIEGGGEKWRLFCDFLSAEMTGLRSLDLTVWSATGSAASFPTSVPAGISQSENPVASEGDWEETQGVLQRRKEEERKWREWEWIHELLQMDALRTARITWWGFENLGVRGRSEGGGFDSWLAGRMVGDSLVRDRMVRDGVVVEGIVVLSGKGRD